MNDPSPLSDLIADDLLLDRLAARVDAGSDPLAGLLGALAAQADMPLPLSTGRRRIGNKHRYLGAFAALAVAASGAGVAAAVTVPAHGSSQADRALSVTLTDDSARSHVPTTPLPRLGLPQTSRSTHAPALVLARRGDGAIVLVPAGFVAAPARPGGGTPGTGETGNGETGNGQAGSSGHQGGGKQAGAAQTPTHGKKPAPATTRASKGTKNGHRDGKDVKKPAATTTPATNQGVGPQTPPTP
ncbi:hypothetical protein [Terrabacter sp. 2YAF2]|uniref:hypothetical protein n=1 Tax=Terrabacter sp. 2YAF2 TaxID=3233026 RepID=UPI003F9CAF99